MIYLNTSQDGACEEGRLGFLLEKGEIFYSSKLSFNLLIFMTSCNNLITCTVSSPLTFPTHWTSHLRFKADLKLWTGSRPRASISRSMNSTCRVSCYFLCVCLYVLSFNLIGSLWVYTRLADPQIQWPLIVLLLFVFVFWSMVVYMFVCLSTWSGFFEYLHGWQIQWPSIHW